jgi:ankyrin repeat protein
MDLTVSSRDQHGNTILIIAAETGDKRLARLAIRFGADPDLVNSVGNTALHVAFAMGTKRVAAAIHTCRVCCVCVRRASVVAPSMSLFF